MVSAQTLGLGGRGGRGVDREFREHNVSLENISFELREELRAWGKGTRIVSHVVSLEV